MSVESVFKSLGRRGEGGLICYITGGDPSPKYSHRILETLCEGGADLLEVGLPFSDPIADGPTIQAASTRALRAGVTPHTVFDIIRDARTRLDTPIILLTYYNPIYKMGLQRFMKEAGEHRVDGLIVPDLPVEEADDYHAAAVREGINTVFLATPSTSERRLQHILEFTSGFLYMVSLFGVTGARDRVNPLTLHSIRRVHRYTSGHPPLAVGFGISRPPHVRSIINSGAEAAIVGSALVKTVEKGISDPPSILKNLYALTKDLKAATRS